jgi:RND family efflux transporter MFP subunit
VVDVTELRKLRISVYVGEDAAPYVKVGTPATVVEDARADKVRHAQVSRIAQALDPRSRTMLCEVWLDNPEEDLYPGTFVHATLHVEAPPLPTVPADAIFTRGGNTEIAVVQDDRRLKFVTVQPGLTDGKTVQVKSGLTGNETVAVSVPSQLGEGAVVKPIEMKPQQPPAR